VRHHAGRHPEEARARLAGLPAALVAGERRGEPLEGFDLGNSPLEFTRARIGGRAVIMTTSNGTRALLAARGAAAIGVAAFVNLGAAAAWALAARRDVLLLCSGAGCPLAGGSCVRGRAGRAAAGRRAGAHATAAAQDAAALARPYGKEVGRLARTRPGPAPRLWRRAATSPPCLTLDTSTVVPVYRAAVDNLVVAHG